MESDRERLVPGGVKVQGKAELAEIVFTRCIPSSEHCAGESREEQGGEKRDDGDNNEELKEGESACSIFNERRPHTKILPERFGLSRWIWR